MSQPPYPKFPIPAKKHSDRNSSLPVQIFPVGFGCLPYIKGQHTLPYTNRINPARLFESPTIQLIVGTGTAQKVFHAHALILTHTSAYFQTALAESASDDPSNTTLSFPETDPDTFITYLDNLYHIHLSTAKSHRHESKHLVEEGMRPFTANCELYLLAVRFLETSIIPLALKALAQGNMRSNRTFMPPMEAVRIVYAGTLEGDALRKVLVGYYDGGSRTLKEALAAWEDEEGEIPQAFINEVAASLWDNKDMGAAPWTDKSGLVADDSGPVADRSKLDVSEGLRQRIKLAKVEEEESRKRMSLIPPRILRNSDPRFQGPGAYPQHSYLKKEPPAEGPK